MGPKPGVLKSLLSAAGIFLFLFLGWVPLQSLGKEAFSVEFYYENVCASCNGDADFFQLYEDCLSQDEKDALQGKTTTYNVFLDSCRERYDKQARELDIPEGTPLPVLIVNGEWASGLAQMEPLLHQAAQLADNAVFDRSQVQEAEDIDNKTVLSKEEIRLFEQLETLLLESQKPVLLLFTTEACEDCESVKDWLNLQPEIAKTELLEYNIIKDPCLNLLKALFRDYNLPEQEQKVPALFFGNQVKTGAAAITALEPEALAGDSGIKSDTTAGDSGIKSDTAAGDSGIKSDTAAGDSGTDLLLSALRRARTALEDNGASQNRQSLLTLAGAGLLAGLNPCSISMLLMLLSIMVTEKASVWKNGLLYLCGKYAAYFTIGLAIYHSAAGLEGRFLAGAGRILNGILILLFVLAGILYVMDALRIFRQDYGKIRTQLPAEMRKWNHNLIKKAGNYTGVLKPLLILGLGMAISVGEFFCTGQIYMASITYLLRDGVTLVWLYFVVYVTAMSLPAFLMLAIIQKTRNTEHISEFMLRHLGAVKIFNALLFFGYAVYFLLF